MMDWTNRRLRPLRRVFCVILSTSVIGLATVAAGLAAPKLLTNAAPTKCAACHGAKSPFPADHVAVAGKAACAQCHERHTERRLAGSLPLSHLHGLNGVTCKGCHADVKRPKEVAAATCMQCHPPEALKASTGEVKPTNPHGSPHFGAASECNVCHHSHAKSENYCAQCHNFEFKVP